MIRQSSGILVLNKNEGHTSSYFVGRIKKKFRFKKVGHGGTLDPMATGVLPICINDATKLAGYILNSDKVYEGKFVLGTETDTHDLTGKIIHQEENVQVNEKAICEAMEKLTGTIEQVPPMFSAIKYNGTPLYKLARRNEVVERKSRQVQIYTFEFKGIEKKLEVSFRVHCSKGVYVRTLCHDLGKMLGTGASLKSLIRTQTGAFKIEDALSFEALTPEAFTQGAAWKSLDDVLKTFPFQVIPTLLSKKIRNGYIPKFYEVSAKPDLREVPMGVFLDDHQKPLALVSPDIGRQAFKLLRVFL